MQHVRLARRDSPDITFAGGPRTTVQHLIRKGSGRSTGRLSGNRSTSWSALVGPIAGRRQSGNCGRVGRHGPGGRGRNCRYCRPAISRPLMHGQAAITSI